MRNLLNDDRLAVDEADALRMMGYPGGARASQPVLEVCRAQLRRLAELALPWGGTREVRVEGVDGDRVRLDGRRVLRSRRVTRLLRRAASLKICLVTLGTAVSAEIRRLTADGCMIEALALDAAASAATSTLMERLCAQVCAEAGSRSCGTTIPYGPGYTGWEIDDMPVLFSCLAGESLPVQLNDQRMMIPEKSLLGVVGIVPGGRRTAPRVVPCRLCDLETCSLRRAPYRGDRGRRRVS